MQNRPKRTDRLDKMLKNNAIKKRALQKIINELNKIEKNTNTNK
jgi:hypothetical protein